MKLLSIQIGLPRSLGDEGASEPGKRPWTTGFFKTPVEGPLLLRQTNLAGDGQADLEHHGGRDKAVCAYPVDHYPYWEKNLARVLPHGAFGENFSLLGALETDVCIGDIFHCCDVELQISQPRQPCWKLARRWDIKDLAARVERTGRTGWYFRVLREGLVESPVDLVLLERPNPGWTVAEANAVMHHRKKDRAAAHALAACPELSESWRTTLAKRAATRKFASNTKVSKPISR